MCGGERGGGGLTLIDSIWPNSSNKFVRSCWVAFLSTCPTHSVVLHTARNQRAKGREHYLTLRFGGRGGGEPSTCRSESWIEWGATLSSAAPSLAPWRVSHSSKTETTCACGLGSATATSCGVCASLSWIGTWTASFWETCTEERYLGVFFSKGKHFFFIFSIHQSLDTPSHLLFSLNL